jgi:light-regulated signal transduction histidine kinase (bacteriophytochrome)
VKSSISIALVMGDVLWGLIVFHSYTQPSRPSVDMRLMLEIAASVTAMRIEFLEREKYSGLKLQLHQVKYLINLSGFHNNSVERLRDDRF